MRQIGEAAIKILGVYYALSAGVALIGFATGVVAARLVPQAEVFASSRQLIAMNMITIIGLAALAAACLMRGRVLAAWLFTDDRIAVGNLSRTDCLFIGISLIGLVWVLSGIPEVIELTGKSIWYAEESRQAMFPQVISQSAEDLFYEAFRSFKHGQPEEVETIRRAFFDALNRLAPET